MEQKSQFIFEVENDVAELASKLPELILFEHENESERVFKVRLDKWLWAARFFKTRPLARAAIENGKVFYDGQKIVPSKEIEIGARVVISQGRNKKLVIIRGLSTRRRSEDEANALFEEIHTNDDDATTPIADFEPKPRKMVRFLRRTIGISDPETTK